MNSARERRMKRFSHYSIDMKILKHGDSQEERDDDNRKKLISINKSRI